MSAPLDEPLYLDFAASAPPAEEVVDAMLPWLHGQHANPHSDHWHGQRAARAVDHARDAIAALIDGDPEGVIFTSGATESNNLALKGVLGESRSRLWVSAIEHKSLLEPAKALAAEGLKCSTLAVDAQGRVSASDLAIQLASGESGPGLVAISHGNNEIGTVQELGPLASIAHEHGHLVHVDASQTAGCHCLSAFDDELDLVCISSHKLYGPAGIGALYVDPALLSQLRPLLHGGGQQRGARSGTVPLFLAVGFGVAAELARRNAAQHRQHLEKLASLFLSQMKAQAVEYGLLGDPIHRVPGHLSLRFPGISADELLGRLLPELSASSGSACASGELRASHALRALGLNETEAGEVVRISFGRTSLEQDAVNAVKALASAVRRIRGAHQ